MAKTTRSATAAKAQKGKAGAKARAVKTGKSEVAASKGAAAKRTGKVPTKVIRKVAKALPKPATKAAAKSAAKPAAPKKAIARPSARKAVVKPSAKKAGLAGKPAVGKVATKKIAAAKKDVARKVVAKKVVAKKVAAKKVVAKKVVAKKVVAKKAAAKKIVAKKMVLKKAAPKKTAAKNMGGKSSPAKKVEVKKPAVTAGKAAKPAALATSKPARKAVVKAAPGKPTSKVVPDQIAKTVSPSPPARLFKGKVASATAMVTPRPATASEHHGSPHANQKNLSPSMNKLASRKLDTGVTREDGRYALPATSTITLPKGYRPSNNEEYMNPQHLAYFRNKLRDWRDQLVEESRQTMDNLRDEVRDVGDEAERATRETENSLELRTRDRYRKLISKIDKALRRIEEGSYGFCEETDEEIGIDRLDARPIATLSLDAQERREHLQKQMGD